MYPLQYALEHIHTHTPSHPHTTGVYRGKVTGIMDFGCFVELMGVRGRAEGLVHVTNMATRRVASAKDLVKRGEEVLWVGGGGGALGAVCLGGVCVECLCVCVVCLACAIIIHMHSFNCKHSWFTHTTTTHTLPQQPLYININTGVGQNHHHDWSTHGPQHA